MKLLLLLMTAGFSESAFAYIDSGTGSLLLQGLLAAIVGALVGIKFYWKKISNAVARLFGRRQSSEKE
jgi:hypothetical protein